MNSIPSIFNQRKISHTVLGGTLEPKKILMPVTCIVLTRSCAAYRARILEKLTVLGFEKIIVAEKNMDRISTNQMAIQFPEVKFLVALESINQGELLNLAMEEAKTEFVLVLQDEMCLERLNFSPVVAKKLMALNQFCVVPRLFTTVMNRLPVCFVPTAKKGVFGLNVEESFSEGSNTFYSADLAGFYKKEKYVMLGGMDYTISSEYWQKLDFFFRAWLWGEKTSITFSFDVFYSLTGGDDYPAEDQTVDISYLRFYLKNLVPVFEGDHARILKTSYLAFKARSSCGFVETMRQFKDAVRWTEKNQYRFKMDAVSLIENWEK